MSRVELVPARLTHVGPIASRMRAADRAECAAFGFTPRAALRRSLLASSRAVTALVDGRPEAMMGVEVRSAIERLGCPWMLGTDAIYRHGRDLIARGPALIADLADSMTVLTGIVGRENSRAIRVLRRWGFTVGDDVRMIGGHAFVAFGMSR